MGVPQVVVCRHRVASKRDVCLEGVVVFSLLVQHLSSLLKELMLVLLENQLVILLLALLVRNRPFLRGT